MITKFFNWLFPKPDYHEISCSICGKELGKIVSTCIDVYKDLNKLMLCDDCHKKTL